MSKRHNLRLVLRDLLDTATCDEDAEAWEQNLKTYDDLLAEVERKRLYVAVAWDEEAVDSIRYLTSAADDRDLPTIKRFWEVLDVVRVMHAAESKREVENYMEAEYSHMPYVINEVRLG